MLIHSTTVDLQAHDVSQKLSTSYECGLGHGWYNLKDFIYEVYSTIYCILIWHSLF
jgi:hypothetical protein